MQVVLLDFGRKAGLMENGQLLCTWPVTMVEHNGKSECYEKACWHEHEPQPEADESGQGSQQERD